MCRLRGINFGYADSERELRETPELFDNAFVDPCNYLDELLNKGKFLALGRKGSGKTAYGAKIRRMSELDSEIVVKSCSLSALNYLEFEENFSNNVNQGGRKFLASWKYLLLLEIVKIIFEKFPNQENEDMRTIFEALKECGALPSADLLHTVQNVQQKGFAIKLGNLLEVNGEKKKTVEIAKPEKIAEIIMRTLKDCAFGETRFYLIIDGLDDVLRGTHFSSDVITGLIRAAEELNQDFQLSSMQVKIVILLRTDIFEMCRDPDLNKIKRDSSINLIWNKDSLKRVVWQRVACKYNQYRNFDEFWRDFAPKYSKSRRKPTETILFEMTLLRPRDVLQFFIECQTQYGDSNRLTNSQFNQVMNGYSQNYFVEEMKDELTGFLEDDVVTNIPTIFSELGKRFFREDDEMLKNLGEKYKVDIHKLLEVMFSAGYVGQVRDRGERKRFSFKHFNPYDHFAAKDQCVIHRGLIKAFNVS